MIPILSAEQTRKADAFTIRHEGIRSIDLMERAAVAFAGQLRKIVTREKISRCLIFCGPGNNGGDGLAVARLLCEENWNISVYYLSGTGKYSADFIFNLERLKKLPRAKITELKSENDFPQAESSALVVDALFGTGLNKPLSGLPEKLVTFLNQQPALKIVVDIPSGFSADEATSGTCFNARHTLTFHAPKLSFLYAENFLTVGEFHALDIGLNREFISTLPVKNFLVETADVAGRLKRRKKFDHKGNFGHAFLFAGGKGKMGAALLCAKACARTGAGLTTVILPKGTAAVMNAVVPEVMTKEHSPKKIIFPTLEKFSAFAFGPGIGTEKSTAEKFLSLLRKITSPAVLDADALNILSMQKNWPRLVPQNSILTPHPKEFERLAGKSRSWHERHRKQLQLSEKFSLYIVLKGANTCITTPEGKSFFNSTGNPGMAKGGSGDVLTGIIVSLLAQKYSAEDACLIGVCLHGLAADLAVEFQSPESLLASDIIGSIGNAFRKISSAQEQ
jgi:NAD(P)H-hydrate epimerase